MLCQLIRDNDKTLKILVWGAHSPILQIRVFPPTLRSQEPMVFMNLPIHFSLPGCIHMALPTLLYPRNLFRAPGSSEQPHFSSFFPPLLTHL